MLFVTRRSQGWAVLGCLLLAVLVQPHLPTWRHARVYRLRHFCAAIQTGMTVDELVTLEKRHGIDRSYAYPDATDESFEHPENHGELVFVAPSPSDQDASCTIERNKVSITQITLGPGDLS